MPPSSAPSRPLSAPRGPSVSAGFTLIELLTVITIIGILAGISFSVMAGINQRKDTAHAQSDLKTIEIALSAFKRQYGDYPQTQVDTELFDALTGKRGPAQGFSSSASYGKVFLDFGRLTLSNPDPKSVTSVGANAIVDPWGHNYVYIYKSPAAGWKNPDYTLYSMGPDGKAQVSFDGQGFPNTSDPSNADNITP